MKATVEYEGYLFTAPFFCMCCGGVTTPQQWAYGRTCARCDTGVCQKVGYGHQRPDWSYGPASREEGIRLYAESVGAEALGTGARLAEGPPMALASGTPKASGDAAVSLLTEPKGGE